MKLFGKYWLSSDDDVIKTALSIMKLKFTGRREKYNENFTTNYLRLLLCDKDIEIFCCIFMDGNLDVISVEEMFFGTVNTVKVHTREIVKSDLRTEVK